MKTNCVVNSQLHTHTPPFVIQNKVLTVGICSASFYTTRNKQKETKYCATGLVAMKWNEDKTKTQREREREKLQILTAQA